MVSEQTEYQPYVVCMDGKDVVAGYSKKSNTETTVVGMPATTEPVLFEKDSNALPVVLGCVPTLGV